MTNIVRILHSYQVSFYFISWFQRVALSTAANMCKKLPSDAADFVMEAVPLLTNLLQYHDAKVRVALHNFLPLKTTSIYCDL
jgi:hypothetical protein